MSTPSTPRRRLWPLACAGCLGLLLIGCLGVVAARALLPSLRFNAQEAYSGAPDRFASAAVNDALTDAGLQGAEAIVIPIKGREGQIAIITMDESQGFRGAGSEAGNEALFAQVVGGIAEANESQDLRIERVSVVYDEGGGLGPVAMTASQETLAAYSAGEISQAEMLAGVEIDISAIISYEQLMDLIQGGE